MIKIEENDQPSVPDELVEYANTQPEPLRSHILEVVETYLRHRQALNDTVLASDANMFSAQQLNAMTTDLLEGTAKLAAQNAKRDVPWFAGMPRIGGTKNGSSS